MYRREKTDLAWDVAGTGDFDGDERADILWRHRATGHVGFWRMGCGKIEGFRSVRPATDLNWTIVGPR